VYICVWRYPVNFSVHYNIHYITFTILVRETCRVPLSPLFARFYNTLELLFV
jgi:hypothetical protein